MLTIFRFMVCRSPLATVDRVWLPSRSLQGLPRGAPGRQSYTRPLTVASRAVPAAARSGYASRWGATPALACKIVHVVRPAVEGPHDLRHAGERADTRPTTDSRRDGDQPENPGMKRAFRGHHRLKGRPANTSRTIGAARWGGSSDADPRQAVQVRYRPSGTRQPAPPNGQRFARYTGRMRA